MSMWFYKLVLFLARPLVRLRLKRRARREPAYGIRQDERFGNVPDDIPRGVVWFHTVSAGETIAAAPLIRKLKDAFRETPFLVTTMTPTGSDQVKERLGDTVSHCYAPYDFGDAVEKFFAHVQPRAIVLMETELWPNWIEHARSRGIPVMVVNARLSEKSARGYKKLGKLVSNMLQSFELIACQTPAHRDRFIGLGASPERIVVTGSVKFDQSLPDDFESKVEALRVSFNPDRLPVWIAASTHPGEDEIVLAAHREIRTRLPEARLVLVPRHPVRVDDVASLLSEAGFSAVRQSEAELTGADVLLGDVMGTLQYLYGLADVAFVGGSLVAVGGHNPIEPALCELPVACGPHQHNFAEIMEALSQSGGLTTITGAEDLARVVGDWLSNEELRSQAGAAAAGIVARNRGAQEQVRQLVQERIASLS